jgi:hypothetical protein
MIRLQQKIYYFIMTQQRQQPLQDGVLICIIAELVILLAIIHLIVLIWRLSNNQITPTYDAYTIQRRTTSFIDISTEAGILLGGNGVRRAMMIARSRTRS